MQKDSKSTHGIHVRSLNSQTYSRDDRKTHVTVVLLNWKCMGALR